MGDHVTYDDEPEPTACWALIEPENPHSSFCGIMNVDNIGLCPEHKHEITGRG